MEKEFPPEATSELTEREREILKLLATGCSNKEIAQKLVISTNTVKVHLRNIFAKIGAASRTEAAMYAVNTGLVQTEASFPNPSEEPAAKPTSFLRRTYFLLIGLIILGVASLGFFVTRGLILQATPTPTREPSPTAVPRWKPMANMPTARSGLAAVSFDNAIYAIGGESLTGVTGTVERYSPQSNSWETRASKPVAAADINAVVIGGKIYVPGGRTAGGKVSNALEIYDPRLDRWEEGARLPTALSAYAMVAFEGKLYLFGGWDGQRFLKTVYFYDPSQDEWQTRSPMPTERGFAGAAIVDETIYVIGGLDGTQALGVNEAYSPARDDAGEAAWDRAVDLPEGRYSMGIASLIDTIYLVGGQGATEADMTPASYIPSRKLWTTFEGPPISIGEGIGLEALGNYLYVIGGRKAQKFDDSTQAYQAIYTVLLPMVPNP